MKILFIQIKEQNFEPLGIELLSALAKREGHECFLSILERGHLEEDLRRIRPDLVAFSAKTGEANDMYRVNEWVTERFGIPGIMGGPHVTFSHKRMLLRGESAGWMADDDPTLERTGMEYLAVGEADESWPLFLRALSAGSSTDAIPGILTRKSRLQDGGAVLGHRTEDLDSLPYLDREVVYAAGDLGSLSLRSHMAARGCPFICTYCFNAQFNAMYKGKGKLLNRYSVDRLLSELADLVSHHRTEYIKFQDDVFAFHTDDWLREFADKYPRAVGVPFHALFRADLIRRDPEILSVLQKGGLDSVAMAIESGNVWIREKVFKRGMTEDDILQAFGVCRKLGLKSYCYNILAVPMPCVPAPEDPAYEAKASVFLGQVKSQFGLKDTLEARLSQSTVLPREEREEMTRRYTQLGFRSHPIDYDLETLDLNLRSGITFSEYVILNPYPGSPLTDYTVRLGAYDGDASHIYETYKAASPFSCFTEEEKRQQMNISLLGLPLGVFPRLQNFAVKYLVRRNWTGLYFLVYFVVRQYMQAFRMFPLRFGVRDLVRRALASFPAEIRRHFASKGRRQTDDLFRKLEEPRAEV